MPPCFSIWQFTLHKIDGITEDGESRISASFQSRSPFLILHLPGEVVMQAGMALAIYASFFKDFAAIAQEKIAKDHTYDEFNVNLEVRHSKFFRMSDVTHSHQKPDSACIFNYIHLHPNNFLRQGAACNTASGVEQRVQQPLLQSSIDDTNLRTIFLSAFIFLMPDTNQLSVT